MRQSPGRNVRCTFEGDMRELNAPVLWLTLRRGSEAGRALRDYECAADDGTPIFRARAWNWRREIACEDAAGARVLLLRRRRSFVFSGRVDIAGADGERLGVVHRSGRFSDVGPTRGRFRDARSLRSRTGESVLATMAELAIGGDGALETSGPTGFIYLRDGRPAGALGYAQPPWAPAHGVASGGLRRLVSRSIARLRPVAESEVTWKLERTGPATEDPRVFVGAALFMMEMSRW
jgi:hypothetical protein